MSESCRRTVDRVCARSMRCLHVVLVKLRLCTALELHQLDWGQWAAGSNPAILPLFARNLRGFQFPLVRVSESCRNVYTISDRGPRRRGCFRAGTMVVLPGGHLLQGEPRRVS